MHPDPRCYKDRCWVFWRDSACDGRTFLDDQYSMSTAEAMALIDELAQEQRGDIFVQDGNRPETVITMEKMMPNNAELIQTLRSYFSHQVSMSECLKVLGECGGDLEGAKVLLNERGLVEQGHSKKATDLRVPDDAPEGWAYILAKVDRYLRLGADIYRKGDMLQMPDVVWDENCLEGVRRCFLQFASGKGYRVESPIENVGISDFSAALKTLHFRKLKQVAFSPDEETEQNGQTVFLDKIQCKHLSMDLEIWLFNKVVYDDSE